MYICIYTHTHIQMYIYIYIHIHTRIIWTPCRPSRSPACRTCPCRRPAPIDLYIVINKHIALYVLYIHTHVDMLLLIVCYR